jgi:hypothetical protein
VPHSPGDERGQQLPGIPVVGQRDRRRVHVPGEAEVSVCGRRAGGVHA